MGYSPFFLSRIFLNIVFKLFSCTTPIPGTNVFTVPTNEFILKGLSFSVKLIDEKGLNFIPPSFMISTNSQFVASKNGFNCSWLPSPL